MRVFSLFQTESIAGENSIFQSLITCVHTDVSIVSGLFWGNRIELGIELDLNSTIRRKMIQTGFQVAFTSVCYPTNWQAVKRIYTRIKVQMSRTLPVVFLIPHTLWGPRIECLHQVKSNTESTKIEEPRISHWLSQKLPKLHVGKLWLPGYIYLHSISNSTRGPASGVGQ